MIPSEVADLCKIIDPRWPDMAEHDFKVALEIAYDIYNAGYRKPGSGDDVGSPAENKSERNER